MCMKYVNANAACYKSIIMNGDKMVSFNAPFEVIKSSSAGNMLFIEDFSVVTQIDFLGTSDSEHKHNNPLEQRKTIDFKIRLTKCSREKEHLCTDLDTFSINLAEMYENRKVSTACFDFLNYTQITNVERVDLPSGDGKYVIKVLIKDSEEDEYSIQSMTPLIIM